jgi:hypothetical protein
MTDSELEREKNEARESEKELEEIYYAGITGDPIREDKWCGILIYGRERNS